MPRFTGCVDCLSPDYPRSVFFIITTELCERFSYYGMRSILTIYLTERLLLSDDTATALYHTFVTFCYLTPLLGACIADGYIGKYKTILYLSIVYAIGNAVMSLTAIPPPHLAGPIVGLLLIALGTGGIKPCVSAFGGDQFPTDQVMRIAKFFSLFYFSINLGSVVSTLLTPVLRGRVRCFGGDCYLVAFGVPALLMIIALVVFAAGTKFYLRVPPKENVIGKVFCASFHAIRNKCKTKNSRKHWLDHADDKYSEGFLDDVKRLYKVLIMYLPLPLFWALFDQQGSRWTLQAQQMDGDIGPFGRIMPDQMQATNAFLILLLIPIFDSCVYPCLGACGFLKRPLQRMAAGMVLAAAAFVVAGFIQIKLEHQTVTSLPPGMSRVQLVNTVDCDLDVKSPFVNASLPFHTATSMMDVEGGSASLEFKCGGSSGQAQQVAFTPDEASVVAIAKDGSGSLIAYVFPGYGTQAAKGYTRIAFVSTVPSQTSYPVTMKLNGGGKSYTGFLNASLEATDFMEIRPGKYELELSSGGKTRQLNGGSVISLGTGGVYYIVLGGQDMKQASASVHTFIESYDMNILWQLPQYFLITMGEVLLSVSGLAFSYSQAPASMKSVLQALWLLMTGLGNFIVVLVAEIRLIPKQSWEFFLFACLMLLDTILFAVLAYFYEYVQDTGYSHIGTDEVPLKDHEDFDSGAEDVPLRLSPSGWAEDTGKTD